jgi:protein-S-isoprenylcysteine O-methyltransferase Ste14
MMNLIRELIQTIAWCICIVYASVPSFWFIVHPFADFWRNRRSPYRTILPAWFAMWIVLGILSARWRHELLYTSLWGWIPAVALFAAGVWLYSRAGNGFSARQLGGIPEVLPGHPEQRLVTTGIRGRMRHPVYLGHLCEMLAWSIGTGLVSLYALTIFAALTGAVMIVLEDKELERRFGEEYVKYRRRVPAVLPLPRI